MQMHNIDTQISDDDALFFTPKKKVARTRKWREIEALKARQRLNRELREIDHNFEFSQTDLI